MTLQFWLLIKYRCCRRRPETQGPSIHIQSESKNHKRKSWHLLWCLCVCVCVCVCVYVRLVSMLRIFLTILSGACARSQECVKQIQGKLWGDAAWRVEMQTALLLVCCCCLWRGDGDFPLSPSPSLSLSVAVADVASELWSNCAFIPPLSPSLSPSLISWRASAAGCPRFTDHLPPPNQCRGCCPSTVEHDWHLLAWSGSATGGVQSRPTWWFEMWDFKILSLS